MDGLLNSYVRWGAEERFSILLDSRLTGAQEVVLTSYSTPQVISYKSNDSLQKYVSDFRQASNIQSKSPALTLLVKMW